MKKTEIKDKYSSAATKLLSKRKELYEAYENLEKKRDYYKSEEKKIKEREQKLKIEDEKIQNDLIKFCRFIKNNENKRLRTENKIKIEKTELKNKEENLNQILKEIAEQEKIKKSLTKKMNSLKKCEDFLLKVVLDYPDQFSSISDLLLRHKNLQSSILMLEERAKNIENEYEKIKNEYSKIEKDKTNQIILLNIDISTLQKNLEKIDSKKKNFISKIENDIQNNFSENVIIARIFMAIDNLFCKCKETNNNIKNQKIRKNEDKENFEGDVCFEEGLFEVESSCDKLDYVMNCMSDLKEIIRKEKMKSNVK